MSVEIRPASLEAGTALLQSWDEEIAARGVVIAPEAGSRVHPDDFLPPRGLFLVAYEGEEPVGCGGLRDLGRGIGEVKRLFIGRQARRRGLGRLLLARLEAAARERGYKRLRLDTNPGNDPSIALFRSAGFVEIPDYNGNEMAAHWFEKELGLGG